MSKSTPINQLPGGSFPDNSFMDEQRRQNIVRAQQAISNNPMPQNTMQSGGDDDDSAMARDILSHMERESAGTEQFTQQDIIMMQQLGGQQPIQAPQMSQQQIPMQQQPIPYQYPSYDAMQNLLMQQQQQPTSVMDYKSFVNNFSDDIKLAGIIFFAVILVHFVPIQALVGKYIAIERIPYHEVILRAIMAALITVIIKTLIKI